MKLDASQGVSAAPLPARRPAVAKSQSVGCERNTVISITVLLWVMLLSYVRPNDSAKACATVSSDFTFKAQQDLYGSDITEEYLGSKTVGDLASLCVFTAGCTAFNIWQIRGDAKGPMFCLKNAANYSSLTSLKDGVMYDACHGIFIRKSRGCPAVPNGFSYFAQQDLFGSDIRCDPVGNKTINVIAGLCASTVGCTAFNIWQQPPTAAGGSSGPLMYCLKNAIEYKLTSQQTGVMRNKCQGIYLYYAQKFNGCAAVPAGFTFNAQMDMFGSDILCDAVGTKTVDDLARLCALTAGCTAFNLWATRPGTAATVSAPRFCLKNAGMYTLAPQNDGAMTNPCQGIWLRNSKAPAVNTTGPKLLWADEFDGASLDASSWNYYDGTAYNNELQYYTKRRENVRVEGGNLVLEARREEYLGKGYTSGRIDTRLKQAFYPGMTSGSTTFSKIRFEARMNLPPKGQGMWPAFWLLPDSPDCEACGPYGGWPFSGEIDILEAVNNMDVAYGTIHFGNYKPGTGRPYNIGGQTGLQLSQQWRTYALEWSATQMWWYVDDIMYFTARSRSVATDGWWAFSKTSKAPGPNSPFDAPFNIILNLAVGGDWPGSPNAATTFPAQLMVDYVRVLGYY